MASLPDLAAEWLRLDPDIETRQEIQSLLEQQNQHELEKRLVGRINFGTAGLRARMEAGFTRMNSLTVLQTTQGLAKYILSSDPEAKAKGVVIGRDARYHSHEFAELAANCFTAHGIRVHWFSDVVHTPLVPFTVDMKGAAAGIMITASHNPKKDNGYKVYWSNGVQIIPPHDEGIAKAIEANLELDNSVFRSDPNLLGYVDQTVRDAYSRVVQSMARPSFQVPPFVYTPMHGVGFKALSHALQPFHTRIEEGSLTEREPSFIAVSKQVDPDPEFPTVKFPNPEEKGALDIAKQVADQHSMDLIIANDPDADRLCVAQKLTFSAEYPGFEQKAEQTWHQFTGNELGVLLASHVLEEASNTLPGQKLAFLNSTVSTGMLRSMVEGEGHYFVETLTGFKWLGNVARQLEDKGFLVPFAFEEALGYMFPSVVHDKDGIASAIAFLSATANWQAKDLNPWQKLQQLYQKYGYFVEANTYLISPNASVTNTIFEDIRALADPYPSQLGSFHIESWRDLTIGYDSSTPDHKPELPVDPKAQMITCTLENNVRFTIRGSGTEPKIKIYVECQADSRQAAEASARAAQDAIIQEWFKPDMYGLQLAA